MYAEADLDYFRSLGEELLSVASGEPDSGSFDNALFYFVDEYDYICTAHDLARLKYYRDPSDQEALDAMNKAYASLSDADEMLWDTLHQVALTDSYDLLADYLGEDTAKSCADYEPSSEADRALTDRETELVNEYYSASTAPEPDLEACADIFIELIEVRRQIAAAAGYDSYADYAYAEVYFRNYTPEDVQSIWAAVKENYVPSVAEVSTVFMDNYAALVESDLQVTSQDLLNAIGTVARGLSPEAAEAYDYLVEHGLCDIDLLSTKAGASFTTLLRWYNEPYIFLVDRRQLFRLLLCHPRVRPFPELLRRAGRSDLRHPGLRGRRDAVHRHGVHGHTLVRGAVRPGYCAHAAHRGALQRHSVCYRRRAVRRIPPARVRPRRTSRGSASARFTPRCLRSTATSPTTDTSGSGSTCRTTSTARSTISATA